jgi:glycerol-3-phosphate acyltransferase PlsX
VTRSVRYAVRIAVDLLGGDSAPAVVVDGVLHALRTDPALHVVVVGPQPAAEAAIAALASRDSSLAERAELLSADDVVAMDERPVAAVLAKSEATVRVAMEALRDGAVQAVFSAGATGATVAAAHVVLGALPGAQRPALAVLIPAAAGPLVLLDVGATPDPTADIVIQHAQLGVAYARAACGVAAPRLGLLSTGVERGKGDALRRRLEGRLAGLAHAGGLGAGARYVGLVEGQHVPLGGPADVVLTDGFTGNVLLKGMEGVVGALLSSDAAAEASGVRGALLLGVGGAVVVGHGAADAEEIASGITLASEAVRGGQLERIAADFAAITDTTGLPKEVLR